MVMETEWTVERALNLALRKEEESIQLYQSAQEKLTKYPASKTFLQDIIKEEKQHREKILQILKDPALLKEMGQSETKIQDLKIVDYIEDVPLSPDADYQQILIFAGKREKTAHDFYMWFANRNQGTKIYNLFIKLAQEELKHKLQFEKEYDDIVLASK
jgi:rubrerythrin